MLICYKISYPNRNFTYPSVFSNKMPSSSLSTYIFIAQHHNIFIFPLLLLSLLSIIDKRGTTFLWKEERLQQKPPPPLRPAELYLQHSSLSGPSYETCYCNGLLLLLVIKCDNVKKVYDFKLIAHYVNRWKRSLMYMMCGCAFVTGKLSKKSQTNEFSFEFLGFVPSYVYKAAQFDLQTTRLT